MANGGAAIYQIFVASTTGYFAVENDAGQVSVFRAAGIQTIPCSGAIALWSCASGSNPRPTGDITALDCHSLKLISLGLGENPALRSLDCTRNFLGELSLRGLAALEYLYIRHNPLKDISFAGCYSLKFIRCSSRQLGRTAFQPPAANPKLACHDGTNFFGQMEGQQTARVSVRDSLTAERYISPRTHPLTQAEAFVRATAYALKEANPEAIAIAAPAMAKLIDGPCWLVPIPASDCSIGANLAVARAIAALVPSARVKIAISRIEPVESSTERRRKGLPGLKPHEHRFVRTAGPMNPFPIYFIDNVITLGHTIRAARAMLGWGTGLAYADATPPLKLSRPDDHPASCDREHIVLPGF